jgi:hypothetical protein
MQHDFSAKAHYAQASITVPALSIESIRSRARAARSHSRARALIMSVAAVIALAAGVGVGAKVADGMRVWLFGNNVATVQAHSGAILLHPMAADLREAISGATFPVVFPVGMATDSRIRSISRTPLKHPSSITITYDDVNGGVKQWFLLIDPAVVSTDGSSLPPGAAVSSLHEGAHWRAGREIVLTNSASFSPRDLARIRAAMMTSTPASSFAATVPLLAPMPVLGDPVRLAIAERYRPAMGRSVLVNIVSVSRQLKARRPLLDTRIIALSWFGDMSKRLVHATNANDPRSKRIVVSVSGVIAIRAVLRSTGVSPDTCRCEVLFNEHSSSTYWIWTIPLSGSGPIRKFAVNTTTLEVTK